MLQRFRNKNPGDRPVGRGWFLFENAFCQVPVCGACASFMTGLYPTAERFMRYYSRADEDAPHVADIPNGSKKWIYYLQREGLPSQGRQCRFLE